MPELHSNTIQLHIAVQVDQIWEFLILHRSKILELYPNVWQVVTGRIEQGENAIKAAIREMKEETGIDNLQALYTLPYIASFFDPIIDMISFVPVFGVILNKKPTITLSDEHQNYHWLNYEEALATLPIPSHKEGTRIFNEYILQSDDRNIFRYKS
jgi:8-oxo-dGTP pyrophosphatase MutT (NUDIX family)